VRACSKFAQGNLSEDNTQTLKEQIDDMYGNLREALKTTNRRFVDLDNKMDAIMNAVVAAREDMAEIQNAILYMHGGAASTEAEVHFRAHV
jgi:peptidoglycan hydrolase CwlO-like protein